jgi:type VI secretion system protein ImpK
MKEDIYRRPRDATVLAERSASHAGRLTGHQDAPDLEHLEARLSYAARLGSGDGASLHINPLVTAASDLLAQVVRLSTIEDPGDIQALNNYLNDLVKAFEASADYHRVPSEQMTAARYVLCTVLDEAVLNTPWGSTSDWSRMSLLSRYHKETFGGEKFFVLLERLSSNPARHLHMLELMYLCLALGFEGKYRVITRGGIELDGIREGLFRQIRHLRGDLPREFSPQWRGLDQPQRGVMRLVPRWQLALITLICLTAMYCGFAWVLGKHRETVLQPFVHTTAPEPESRT